MPEAESSSTYQSLYRKWRPQKFGDVVSQQYTIKTLQNALERDEMAHAYLFAGPRGTGKTSIARIFAKAVNCPNRNKGEPCGECDICGRIARGSELDVIEIDGASNRGIDQIRQLREQVNFAPSDCPHKIYIIDEVHMLTNEAFNALLKTLEEPPKHVIFIFATTESHKVPATVLSRCQAFEFRQIAREEMASYLAKISSAEGYEMEDGIFDAIARHARGAMRDGLVLLEQLISYKGQNEISSEDLYEILGLPSEMLLDEFLTALRSGDHATSLKIINDLADRGRDLDLFMRELLHRCRAHLVEELEKSKGQLSDFAQSMMRLTSNLLEIKREMRYAFDKRILLEVKILELGQPKPLKEVVVQAPAAQPQASPEISKTQPTTSSSATSHQTAESPVIAKESDSTTESEKSSTQAEAPVAQNDTPTETVSPPPQPSTEDVAEEPDEEISAEAPEVDVPAPAAVTSQAWPDLLHSVKGEKIAVHALLKEAGHRIEGSTLVVEFPEDFGFHKDRLEQKDNFAYLREKVKQIFGEYQVRVGFSESMQSNEPTPGVVDEEFKKKIELVREAFDGEIVS